jgi:dihydroorotate dehydrogenase (NAD+) catalytic subunit
VVGCGGISNWRDAIEFIMAGASAVEVGTANFSDAQVSLDILSGIERFLVDEGIAHLSQIVGAAKG